MKDDVEPAVHSPPIRLSDEPPSRLVPFHECWRMLEEEAEARLLCWLVRRAGRATLEMEAESMVLEREKGRESTEEMLKRGMMVSKRRRRDDDIERKEVQIRRRSYPSFHLRPKLGTV